MLLWSLHYFGELVYTATWNFGENNNESVDQNIWISRQVDKFSNCGRSRTYLPWSKLDFNALHRLLNAFENLQTATISFIRFVYPSFCLRDWPYAWTNSAPTGRIFMKFRISEFFKYMSRKLKFYQNLRRIMDTLLEDLCTYMIISRWILVRMWNFSDEICEENQNANFIFNDAFPKIVPFVK
jgi:hypothetical protein